MIFAQAAGDPIKVVAATQGADRTATPIRLVVPKGSSIRRVEQLRGQTVAAPLGTISHYFLVQVLHKAHIPYHAVHVVNLSPVDASTAVSNGHVDAAVVPEPLAAEDLQNGSTTQLVSMAGYAKYLSFFIASVEAIHDRAKAAAIADFIVRLYRANAVVTKQPNLAAQVYTTIYGVSPPVAQAAAASVRSVVTPITPSIIQYVQQEANTFRRLGLLPNNVTAASMFDLAFNKKVNAQAGLS
jgi:sulfonate transport system substrate-binding protein